VTVAIARTPVPGREDDLVTWAHGIAEAAEAYDGHLGARILRTGEEPSADVVVAFSFDSAEHLQAWESSPVRRDWLGRLEGLVTGAATTHAVSGFESIFARPQAAVASPPPRWKTAVVIALALYPASVVLGWALGPLTQSWSVWARALATTLLVVPYMAWVGVPTISRWLHGWLRRG
jgi:antibiotic biosynthesis monooxygenase (ABM) superfamily enzyme